jgi:hypothetical protein
MDTPHDGPFELESQRLGALPVISHFLDRIGLDAALGRWLGEPDPRLKLSPVAAIRLLVINLLTGRAPLYGLAEWAAPYAPALLGLPERGAALLNDDRVGRALPALFDADRASLLTELIVGVIGEFGVDTSEMQTTPRRCRCTASTRPRTAARAGASRPRRRRSAIPRTTAPTSSSWCGS